MEININEIKRTYPNCVKAIFWTELMICEGTPDDPESSWEFILKQDPNTSPLQMLHFIREAAKNKTFNQREAVLEQIDHPSFLTYLSGKLGYV